MQLAQQSTVAIVCVAVSASGTIPKTEAKNKLILLLEGFDRQNLSLGTAQDELVKAVAAANPNTIVVLHIPGAVLMPWINVTAAGKHFYLLFYTNFVVQLLLRFILALRTETRLQQYCLAILILPANFL